ncbi:MAG TPA: PTS transporter subunit EIIB [Acholeplasmataceae bacterium]|nr:PTS transporter subunit EIIB [Acholeplasmataceae bacterium]
MLLNISSEIWAYIILAIAIIPIIGLMVYAIIVALRRSSKMQKQREKEISESSDDTQIELFMNVYGGKDNIKDVKREMGRISVEVENIEKVDVEELKNLGATGILLVGNVVKSAFGDRAPYIYNILINGKDKND